MDSIPESKVRINKLEAQLSHVSASQVQGDINYMQGKHIAQLADAAVGLDALEAGACRTLLMKVANQITQ
eukprot:2292088-Karenia_brevis.AAC.1